jgi:hypothetical protein
MTAMRRRKEAQIAAIVADLTAAIGGRPSREQSLLIASAARMSIRAVSALRVADRVEAERLMIRALRSLGLTATGLGDVRKPKPNSRVPDEAFDSYLTAVKRGEDDGE